jgi:hypothetical protein
MASRCGSEYSARLKAKAMLCELARDIWIAERPQRFYGLAVGTRMTVIRLADGSLMLHYPVALDPELRRELDSLGCVRFAVAVGPQDPSAALGRRRSTVSARHYAASCQI